MEDEVPVRARRSRSIGPAVPRRRSPSRLPPPCSVAASCSIFPEGTRSRDGRLHKGRTGAARLALEVGAPILVGVVGTDRIQPPDARLPKLTGSCSISIGRPIMPARYAAMDERHRALRAMTDEVMFEIRELTGQNYVDRYAGKTDDAGAEPDRPARPTRHCVRGGGRRACRRPTPGVGRLLTTRRTSAASSGSLPRLAGDGRPDHDHASRRFPAGVPGRDHRRGRRRIGRQAPCQGGRGGDRRRSPGRPRATARRRRPRRSSPTTPRAAGTCCATPRPT